MIENAIVELRDATLKLASAVEAQTAAFLQFTAGGGAASPQSETPKAEKAPKGKAAVKPAAEPTPEPEPEADGVTAEVLQAMYATAGKACGLEVTKPLFAAAQERFKEKAVSKWTGAQRKELCDELEALVAAKEME